MDTYRLWRLDYDLSIKDQDQYIVDFLPQPLSLQPKRWSSKKRFSCTVLLAFITLLVTVSSSIGSGTYSAVSERFKVSSEVAEMTTSLFLVGFAIGAPLFAPLCEELGRLPVYIFSLFVFSCFEIGAATSKNMASLAICRFFAGFFGTSPLSNAGGSVADMWDIESRTTIFPFFSVASFIGPVSGSIIGAYITQNVNERWCHYIVAIFGYASTLLAAIIMPETYESSIMDFKANSLRRQTGNDRFVSLHELKRNGKSPFSFEILMRPFIFSVTEPIVTAVTLAISITYIVLFSHFESFPVIYSTWDFSTAKSTLPFISIMIGIFLNYIVVTPLSWKYLKSISMRVGGYDNIASENRLIPLMFCAWCIPISLFWLAWTTYESISPWSAIVSGIFFGFGITQVFITSYMYLIDSYGVYSASALATLTLVRYCVSAGMIHVTGPMYKNLGIHWAASLLAFISLLICLVPFIFYKFGPLLRSKSKFASSQETGSESDNKLSSQGSLA